MEVFNRIADDQMESGFVAKVSNFLSNHEGRTAV
jgi:hypothetical protein